MTHKQTNTTIRSMLRALENNIVNARAKRLGTGTDSSPELMLGLCSTNSEPELTSTSTEDLGVHPDGTPRIKAKRKATTSFTTTMPTRSVWDRKAG